MEIIKNFGVNPALLVAQILNFLVILFILKRFLYKPLIEMLEKRKSMVAEGVENARKAQELLEETTEKEKIILRKAQDQAKIMLAGAKKQQIQLLHETEEKTKKQAEIILSEARTQIAFEAKETEKKLASKVSELAVFFLQKSLAGIFSEKEQETIVKNALKKIREETN